ncbi:hypothetical protein QVD17_41555 [Tagetes erecta]|uniref:RNA-directed DNA polymerase, eukaryota, Reverse transcriptase zinc-binding domain protein n=1 Tax=Tagetes erecta TaxID=13708 RepID=A0AAD8NDS4_TARER|nr:hypothetical protein QVD17_41555 [Tagetes erecta]
MESSNLIHKIKNIDGKPIMRSILKDSSATAGSKPEGNPTMAAKDDEKREQPESMNFANKLKEGIKFESQNAAWNIRGLNRPLKQNEVKRVIQENNIQICAVLESHVSVDRLASICKRVFRDWDWSSNGNFCDKGTRIILGWNPNVVDVMVISQASQVVHAQVFFKKGGQSFLCSFVYAKNYYCDRRELWEQLNKHKIFARSMPWVILGDFNVALNSEDCAMGSSKIDLGVKEFRECVQNIEMIDINCSGLQYTWTQKPTKGIGILKKIDRVMGNLSFVDLFPNAHAMFHPYRISDHSPCILRLDSPKKKKARPFKFANFLVFKKEFQNLVTHEWRKEVAGNEMFKVVKKLKLLKPYFRKLLYAQGNLHNRVNLLRKELDDVQCQMDKEPHDIGLRDKERKCLLEYEKVAYDLELFLKQKSKVEWLRAGDSNTAFFHKSLKRKLHKTMVDRIIDGGGNVHTGDGVTSILVEHYSNFLGTEGETNGIDLSSLGFKKLSALDSSSMVRQITDEEVKSAMFDIGEYKSPGEVQSCKILMKGLEEFKSGSGLTASVAKSTVFLCQVPLTVKRAILAIMPFAEGRLPVRYLGVPLISSNLPKASMSWGWRKILQLREVVRPYIHQIIGDGKSTFIWSDRWCDHSPLSRFVTTRAMYMEGFSRTDKVADLVIDRNWSWPIAWYDLFPVLINIPVPLLSYNRKDVSIWHDNQGVERKFSIHIVWETIRHRNPKVPWYNMVWFRYCIPRHAFHVWLVCRKKLNTQDKMKMWDMNMSCCMLCMRAMDSHAHLFFECEFSNQIWKKVRRFTDLGHIEGIWDNIVSFLITRGKWESINSIIDRLVIGATSYYVWQERNARLFTSNKRNPNQISALILENVRLKLISMEKKKMLTHGNTIKRWNLEQTEDSDGKWNSIP